MDGAWRLIREEAHDGPTNMALDEVAAETAAGGGPRTVRVFQWDPSTLSLGYAQESTTVDWDWCRREGVDVVRRPTGGGGIYHDIFGDISYSIAIPADAVPGDLLEAYRILLEPIIEALDRMGVQAMMADREQPAMHAPACYLRAIHPAHDIVVDGRKISGNAQHRWRDAIVQHGSLTFARETPRHVAAFADPGVTPEEFEGRVTSIQEQAGIDRAEAVETLERVLAEWSGAREGAWDEAELARAGERVRDRFNDEAWTRRR